LDTLETTGWIIKLINDALDTVNNALDFIFLWGGLALILGYPFYSFFKNIKKNSKKKQSKTGDLISQALILLLAMLFVGLIWLLPELSNFIWPKIIQKGLIFVRCSTAFRWFILSSVLLFLAYIFGHENGGKRGLHSSIGHIVLVFLGLAVDSWTGILFISLPLLAAYYSILYRLALITLPTSNPEDRTERWKRFIILVSYTWGIQFPLIVVDGNGWNKTETRIPGDFTWDYPVPGLIWTKSHQVVAITSGIKFNRVDGPGVVFTGSMERPEQIFDLRLQLRTNEIDVVSKDGVSFKVRVFTGFRIDPEAWDKDLYDKLRPMNAILRGADKPTYTKGSFPYSNLRVQAALGVTSTKATTNTPIIYWDQWAVNIVEDKTRKVISQKNLDELWRPAEDKKYANALDIIAKEIKENAEFTLRTAGILLLVARVVNFQFPDMNPDMNNEIDGISRQQLATWSSEWDRKRIRILAEAEAESEHSQQEARAYAESLLLNSIAEGLQKAKDIDPELPQYVIAMRFLSSLQDYVHKQTDEKSMEELQNSLQEWQDQFLTNYGKEK
jgi:regulator of protease activity HflC (stomatin/prohibitin superfamily)